MIEGYTNPTHYLIGVEGPSLKDLSVLTVDPEKDTTIISEQDARLGANINSNCLTCKRDIKGCPNHVGGYKIYPVPLPLSANFLKNWVSVMCWQCGRIPLDYNERKRILKGDLAKMKAKIKSKPEGYMCPFASKSHPHEVKVLHPVGFLTKMGWDFRKPALFFAVPPRMIGENRSFQKMGYIEMPIVDNHYLWKLLDRAHPDDLWLMGFHPITFHPRNLLTDFAPVILPAAKPKASSDPSENKKQGSKTKNLYAAISTFQIAISRIMGGRTIHELQTLLARNPTKFNELIISIHMLYYALHLLHQKLPDPISTVVHSELGLGPQTIVSMTDLLRRKGGILRKFFAAVRLNVIARTPLAGLTYGAIGTASLPKEMAMKISIPVMVNPLNLQLMKLHVLNGPDRYPGANAYKRGNATYNLTGKNIDLKLVASSLMPGDIIQRHVMTGDIGFHQRYPSIREESMSAKIIVVIDDQLIKQPLATCNMQMADFDGDETQWFFLPNMASCAEILLLESIVKQFITPGTGSPAVGAIDNAVSGLNELMKKNKFTREEMNMMCHASFTDIDLSDLPKNKTHYSFKDLIELVLPEYFYYDARTKSFEGKVKYKIKNGVVTGGENKELVIRKGKYVKGMPTVNGFVLGNGDILKAIANTYDSYTAIKVLENLTRFAYVFNERFGNSFGDDIRYTDESVENKIRDYGRRRVEKLNAYALKFRNGMIITPVGKDPFEFYESVQTFKNAELWSTDIRDLIIDMMKDTSVVRAFSGNSRIMNAVVSALGIKGQLFDQGRRFRMELCHGNRYSVYFPRGDDSAEASGYVDNNYTRGLNPAQYCYEAIPSLKEAYDKGQSVSFYGYLNRKINTSLITIHIGHFGEVRGHSNGIISFSYGQTGADPRKTVNIFIDAHIISDREFEKRYKIGKENEDEMNVLYRIRNEWREAIYDCAQITSVEKYNVLETTFQSPVDIDFVYNVCHDVDSKDQKTKLEISKVWKKLDEFREKLFSIQAGPRVGRWMRKVIYSRIDAFLRLFRFTVYTKKFLEDKWTMKGIDNFLNSMVYMYGKNLASPGDPVGMKAALEIIWPQTQAQLHATRGTTVTGAVEMLNRTRGTLLFAEQVEGKTVKNPISFFMLEGDAKFDKAANIRFGMEINTIKLKDVLFDAKLLSATEKYFRNSELGKIYYDWMDRLSPVGKKLYDRTTKSEFYIMLHLNTASLLYNHVNISKVDRILEMQYGRIMSFIVPIYLNEKGFFIFINMRIDLSLKAMNAAFESMVEHAIVHGLPPFRNATILDHPGIPIVEKDGSLGLKEAYRIMFNGTDTDRLLLMDGVDKRTIVSNSILDSYAIFGVEEARFRMFTCLWNETYSIKQLTGLQPKHLNVLTDHIARLGWMCYITRTYIGSNEEVSLLSKMVFETPDQFLIDSLPNSLWRKIQSPMECVMYGKVIPYGSGISRTLIKIKDVYPPEELIESILEKVPALSKTREEIERDNKKEFKRTGLAAIGYEDEDYYQELPFTNSNIAIPLNTLSEGDEELSDYIDVMEASLT